MVEINRRTIEIAASLVFIVLLILIAVTVIDKDKANNAVLTNTQNARASGQTTSQTSGQIINNYGNYYENYYENGGDSNSKYSQRYQSANTQRIDYRDTSGQTTEKEFLNNYITTYYVDIHNRETHGMYFTVIFNFEDKNNFEFSERITLYLRPDETKRFGYRDFQYEPNEIVGWNYRVIAKSA